MDKSGNYKKYVIGRTFVKATTYEAINTGRRRKAQGQTAPAQPMTAEELDMAYQYRQRAKVEHLLRLADVNFTAGKCVFVTLTFRENVTDYDTAVAEFKAFTKRLRRAFDSLRYIATVETQQRGAYHFHALVNVASLQDGLDFLLPCWHNGSADVKLVTDVKSTVLYMTKDFTKQNRSHPLFNRRCYFVSQGLTKCAEVTSWNSDSAELDGVRAMLAGKVPNKQNKVNGTKAGETEYADFYFCTNAYTEPLVAQPKC